MAIDIARTADGIGLLYTGHGRLTAADLQETSRRARSAIRKDPSLRYVFIDHSAVPEQQLDSASISDVAQRAAVTLELIPEGFVAIVAPTDALYGLSRMWQSMAAHPRLSITVQRTREPAVQWLREQLEAHGLPFKLT